MEYLPPPPPYYPPPGPPVRGQRPNATVWLVIACAVVVVVILPVFGAGLLAGGAGQRERPEGFDDRLVRGTAGEACATLDEDLSDLPWPSPALSDSRLRSVMDAENVAVDRLVTRMRSLGDERLDADPPAQRWLSDWESLVEAREEYAAALDGGIREPLRESVPQDADGRPITEWMSAVTLGCDVPIRLYDPDLSALLD